MNNDIEKDAAELLPCPFCGMSFMFDSSNGAESCFIECNDCGACGPTCSNYKDALQAWNTHATAADKERIASLSESAKRWGWDERQDLWRWVELRFVAAKRLEDEQREGRNSSTEFTRSWYSGRMETMHAWMRKADVPEAVKHAYFSIVANGSAPGSMVSPEMAQEYLNGKVTEPIMAEMDQLRAQLAAKTQECEGLREEVDFLVQRVATLEQEVGDGI